MSSTTPTTPSATGDSPRVITTVNPAAGDELSQYAAWPRVHQHPHLLDSSRRR